MLGQAEQCAGVLSVIVSVIKGAYRIHSVPQTGNVLFVIPPEIISACTMEGGSEPEPVVWLASEKQRGSVQVVAEYKFLEASPAQSLVRCNWPVMRRIL